MRRIFSYLKGHGGFSLAELVVYLGILGVTMTVFTGVLDTVTKTQVRESTQNEISGQLNFAVQTMQRIIKSSSIIEGTPGAASSTISLQMPQAAKSPTKIYLQNNQIYVQEGSSTPQTITTDKISVDSLEFRKFAQPGAKDVVQIDIAMSQFQPTTGKTVSRSLRSAISRADAVTFDSDLLPPTDATFNVGAWPSLRWKDGAFSGTVRAGSLCINGDCKDSWGAISGVQGTGSQNYLARWLTAGSLTSSVIYDNGTNVGIGAINPAAKLHVVDGDSGDVALAVTQNHASSGYGATINVTNTTASQSALEVSTGGTFRFRVMNDGSVAIGLTSPDSNYKITTSGGGIKAESASAQPAGYFNNSSTGNSLVTGSGAVKVGNLAGTGSRMVVAGADGTLTTQAISTGSVTGGGTANYIAKWTSGTNVATSTITDDGTNVNIGANLYLTGNNNRVISTGGMDNLIFEANNDSNTGTSFTFRGGIGPNTFMTISSGGNVGIGTTNPTNGKLEVNGTVYATTVRGSGLGNYFGNLSSNYPYANLAALSGAANNIPLGIKGYTGQTANLTEWSDANGVLDVINATGSLGIGTTSPADKLHVVGNATVTGIANCSANNSAVKADANGRLMCGTVSPPSGNYVTGSGTANRLTKWGADGVSIVDTTAPVFESGGNIGIGTSSPSQTLTVANTFSITATAGIQSLLMGNQDSTGINNPAMIRAANGDLDIGHGTSWTGSGGTFTSTAIFKNNGSVGIGTTPSYKLDVNGDVRISSTSDGILNLRQLGLSGTAGVKDPGWNYIQFQDSEGDRQGYFGIDSSGNFTFAPEVSGSRVNINSDAYVSGSLGIGTSPADKLHVNGNATVTGIANCAAPAVLRTDANGRLVCSSNGTTGYVLKSGDTMSGNLNMNGNDILAVDKLTVTTIDPLYNIGGEKYATYASAIAGGVKEEYVGKGILAKTSKGKFQKSIDFSKVEKGSDLWVWHKAVEFSKENVEAIATPYGEAAQIYYVIKGDTLTFKASSDTDSDSIEFSYRLIGKRYDWREHPTYAKDQSEPALLIRP
jgi:hypothetical protein